MTVMRQVTFLLLGAGGVWNDGDGEQHARPIASHATLRVSLCNRCRHARPIASHATPSADASDELETDRRSPA